MTIANQSANYNFIFESAEFIDNNELEILEESKTPSNDKKVKFRTKLQQANVVNKNKRRYSTAICESITNQLKQKAQNNSLLSELNHPMSGSPEEIKRRAAIIDYNNCCAKINDIIFKDDYIIGEVTTLSSFKGPELAKLIVDDRVNIGFSLRALGSIKPISEGILEVSSPIMAICYDVVSNPSHSNARIIEFLPENDNHIFNSDNVVVYEGEEIGLLKAEDNIEIPNNNIIINAFLDDVIQENFQKIVSTDILFRI